MIKLTKTVLGRPIAAIIIVAGLLIFGASSLMGLDLQLIPDMEMPMMIVSTVYPQAGPEEIDRLVTTKIEDTCSTIEGVDTVQSMSQESASMVILQFEYGTNMDKAFIDMQEAIQRVKSNLPEDANSPTIITMDINATSSMTLSIETDEEIDILAYAKDTVQEELNKLLDVAEISVSGGEQEYISIQLIPEYMNQYGLNISAVASAVSAANFSMPAGSAEYGSKSLSLSTEMEYADVPELETIPITTAKGQIIHLSDIANVQYTTKAPESYSRYSGNKNISLDITKKQESSAVTLSQKVMKVIDRLNAENPDIKITTVYDSSEVILDALKSIGQTLLLGIVLSMIVLFAFFGDFKGSLIVGSSMPISLLLTFILMSFMGFSLNMVTMGALVIGIGMMVDNAIVVIEMCFRKIDQGFDYKDAAYEGSRLVINSIAASTITTVVVYLPLSLLKGISGQMFSQLGFTIIFALMTSLFSAITLVPLCFSRYKPIEKKEIPVSRLLDKVANKYGNLLEKALHRKKLVALISIVIFAVSILMAQFINAELMSSTDEGQISISMKFRPGLTLDNMDQTVRELEAYVAADPDIDNYTARVSETSSSATISAYIAEDSKALTVDVVDRMAQELAEYQGDYEISVSAASSMGMTSMGGGNSTEVRLFGDDLGTLKEAAKEVADMSLTVPGVLNASSSLADAGMKAEVVVDPIKAAANEFTPKVIASNLYMTMNGSEAMTVSVNNNDYSVRVEYPVDEYVTMTDVEGMSFTNNSGVNVPLMEMAEIRYTDSPQTIQKIDGRYLASVTVNLTSETKFIAPTQIQEKMAEIYLPEGVDQATNSMDEMMIEEFTALVGAIITAIILIFMVMAIQFESIRYSLLIMFCIPFSLIGSFLLLLLTQSTFNMVSIMGFLMLVGIVVNNGIIYVDTVNRYRKDLKMHTEEALIAAGKSRLRPILMTTLTTILSMVPMAIGVGKNAEMMQGMAVVICGGLTASTILTLVLLPTFYMIIHKRSKEKKLRLEQEALHPELKKQRKFGFKKKNKDHEE